MDKVLEKIDETVFHAEQMRLESADVRLQMPKFKFDLTSHLNQVLQNVSYRIQNNKQAKFEIK